MWDEILHQTEHRPWQLTERPYAMTMTWEKLLFAHWPMKAERLRALIPTALELDTFEGVAYVGIVPFAMRNVGPRLLPKPAALSTFLELNVRTYVTAGGKPGVFFFSLDAANPIAVEVARRWFHLPYFNAAMNLTESPNWIAYQSERTHRGFPPGLFRARYRPIGPLAYTTPRSLESWLTERYCLYAVDGNGIAHRGEIHHLPWPLQPAELEVTLNSVVDAHGFKLPDVAPLLHYAERLDVLAWNPQTV